MSKELSFVHGLRFLMAAWVVEIHTIRPHLKAWWNLVPRFCHYSVVSFFVIAGFFSYMSLHRSSKSRFAIAAINFYVSRLVPVALAVAAVSVWALARGETTWAAQRDSWFSFDRNVFTSMWTLTGRQSPNPEQRLWTIDEPLWYLSPQTFLWLLSPALYRLMQAPPQGLILSGILLVCLYDWIVLYCFQMPAGYDAPGDLVLSIFFSWVTYLPKHLCGMLAAALVVHHPLIPHAHDPIKNFIKFDSHDNLHSPHTLHSPHGLHSPHALHSPHILQSAQNNLSTYGPPPTHRRRLLHTLLQRHIGYGVDLGIVLFALHYFCYPYNPKGWKHAEGSPESWFGVTLFATIILICGWQGGRSSLALKFLGSRWFARLTKHNVPFLIFVFHAPMRSLFGFQKFTDSGYTVWLTGMWLAAVTFDRLCYTPFTKIVRQKMLIST